jgi:hypothetical protein
MDRNLFLKKYYETHEITGLDCPQCHNGKLIINKENISLVDYVNNNKEAESYENFDIDWLRFGFHGFFLCNNCGEKIIFAGKSSPIIKSIDEDECPIWCEALEIEYIERPPYIIKLNKNIPKELKEILVDSFKLFWTDISSCANKIRICLEIIMDIFEVKKYRIVKNKRRILSLHERIGIFTKDNKILEDILTSIKWIGNFASHNEKINKEDVLDGYTLLEYALSKIYNDKEKEILNIAKSINKIKKPRSKK